MARARELARQLRERLSAIPGLRPMDRGSERGASAASIPVSDRDDAVIDMDEKRVRSVLRFSPHYYNTEQELETAALALEEELGRR